MSPEFPSDAIFEIEITDIAPDGRGIGIHEGQRVHVPYTIPGEILTVRLIENRDEVILAEGVTMLEPSADRVEPACRHFGAGRCGICQWQHINYEAQLALKTDILATHLAQHGFRNPPLQFTLPSPAEWQYAAYTTFLPTPDGALGYLSTDQKTVIPIEECPIIRPDVMALFDELDLSLATLKSLQIHAGSTGEPMIVMETTDDEPPELESTLPASLNFLLSHHEPFNMIGATHIKQQIFDRIFRITAGVPYRANIPQVEKLVEVVLNYLDPQPKQAILDVYGGIGTFSAFIAPRARLVTYIDSYPPAATDAEENLNDLVNVDILEGRADSVLSEMAASRQREHYDAMLVDPPVQGLNRGVLETLKTLAIPTLVYVSQNPATFGRDARTLVDEFGYRLLDIQPLDFAPQTAAIECVGLFRRK